MTLDEAKDELRRAWATPPNYNGGPKLADHPDMGLLPQMRFLKFSEQKFDRLVAALKSLPSFREQQAFDPDLVRLLWRLPEAINQSLDAMYERALVTRQRKWEIQGAMIREVGRILGGPYMDRRDADIVQAR